MSTSLSFSANSSLCFWALDLVVSIALLRLRFLDLSLWSSFFNFLTLLSFLSIPLYITFNFCSLASRDSCALSCLSFIIRSFFSVFSNSNLSPLELFSPASTFFLKYSLSDFSRAISRVNSLILLRASSNDHSFPWRDRKVFSRRSSISCSWFFSFSIFWVNLFLSLVSCSDAFKALLRFSLSDFSRSNCLCSISIVLLASCSDLLLLFKVRVAFVRSSFLRNWFSWFSVIFIRSLSSQQVHSLASMTLFKRSFSERCFLTSSTKASIRWTVLLFISSILCNWVSSSPILSDCNTRRSLSHLSCLISSSKFFIVSSCSLIQQLASSTSFALLFMKASAASVRFFNWTLSSSVLSFCHLKVPSACSMSCLLCWLFIWSISSFSFKQRSKISVFSVFNLKALFVCSKVRSVCCRVCRRSLMVFSVSCTLYFLPSSSLTSRERCKVSVALTSSSPVLVTSPSTTLVSLSPKSRPLCRRNFLNITSSRSDRRTRFFKTLISGLFFFWPPLKHFSSWANSQLSLWTLSKSFAERFLVFINSSLRALLLQLKATSCSLSSLSLSFVSDAFDSLAVKVEFSRLKSVISPSSFLSIFHFSHLNSYNWLFLSDSFADSSEDNMDFSLCNFAISSLRSLIVFVVSYFSSFNCVLCSDSSDNFTAMVKFSSRSLEILFSSWRTTPNVSSLIPFQRLFSSDAARRSVMECSFLSLASSSSNCLIMFNTWLFAFFKDSFSTNACDSSDVSV